MAKQPFVPKGSIGVNPSDDNSGPRAPIARPGLSGISVRLDRSNEEQVILAVVVDPKRVVELVRAVEPDVFGVDEHVEIWRVFREQLVGGSLLDEPAAHRGLSAAAGRVFREIAAASRTVTWEQLRVETRVKNLAEDSIRRRTIDGPLQDLVRGLCNPRVDLAQVQVDGQRLVKSLSGGVRSVIAPGPMLRRYQSSRRARSDGRVYGIGYEEFDRHLGVGFAPRGTTLLTGESGEGKSAVAANLTRWFARQGRRVLYCCWEEDPERVADKIASAETRIDFVRVCRGGLSVAEERLVEAAVSRYVSPPDGSRPTIIFADNPFLDLWLSAKGKLPQQRASEIIQSLIAASGADVVIYDMWERSIVEPALHAVEKAYEATQAIHKRFDVHGILIGQMNIDKIRNKAGKKDMENVKGSKRSVEVSDTIGILDRPSARGHVVAPGQDFIDVRFVKQRAGLPFGVRFSWRGEYQLIEDPREIPSRGYDTGADDLDAGVPDFGSEDF